MFLPWTIVGMPLKPSKDRLSIPTPQLFGLICDTSMLIWEWEFKKLPEVSLWSHLMRSYKKNNSKNVKDKWWRLNYLWITIMTKKKLGQRMWITETMCRNWSSRSTIQKNLPQFKGIDVNWLDEQLSSWQHTGRHPHPTGSCS